jgi:RNA polymerase sigma factor (sigma-70 family)
MACARTEDGPYPAGARFLLEGINDIIRRKIAGYVQKYRRRIETSGLQDVDREVLVDMLARLPHIVERFLTSGRPWTQQNFESWLSVCIHHKVLDLLRAAPPATEPIDSDTFAGLPALQPTDPVARARLHEWFAKALAVLDPLSRELLEARLLGGEKPASLAKQHGLPVGRVSDLIFSAKLRLRNEMIAAIAEHALAVRPTDQPRFETLIAATCTRPHRCHAYRHPCPRACDQRDEGALLDDFADFVMVELDAWDLPPSLDRCYWAAK